MDPERDRRWWQTEVTTRRIVFAVLLVSYAYFFQGGGWNPNSRYDLTRGLAERGTIRIDDYRENTGDFAFRGGHFYTNKAPGLSFLSVPFWIAGGWIAGVAAPEGDGAALLIRGYVTNVGANALPAALLGLMMMHVLWRLGIAGATTRAWLVLAYGFGTLAFPYATGYYAHQLAAALGFTALAAMLDARAACSRPRLWSALSGAAAGAAVLVESSALVVAVVLGVVHLLDREGRARLVPFVLGGLPFAAIFAWYNDAAFGHPLASSYAFSNPGAMFSEDGSLLDAPRLGRMRDLLVSPFRGLFFGSPVLLLALLPPAWSRLYRADRRAALVCAAVPLGFLVLISAFAGWHGGWAPGPRYLVPCLPFLFVPAALAAERLRVAGAALGALSAAIMLAVTAVAIEVPIKHENPLTGFVLPHLAAGRVSVNPQGLDEFRPPEGYVDLEQPDNWNSFNLGEFVFPHRVPSLIPLLAAWGVGAWALWRLGRRWQRGNW